MGFAKRMLMEEESRLYRASDETICVECFDDTGLREFVCEHAVSKDCSVCHRSSDTPIAASANDVLEFFLSKIHEHYEDANGTAPYDNESPNGFAVKTVRLYDLINHHFPEIAPYETLEWLQSRLKDDIEYCKRDWQVMTMGEALVSGWERFCFAVKHETRFLFFTEKHSDDSGEPYIVYPDQMLMELGDVVRGCGLVKTIASGTKIYRVRGHMEDHPFTSPAEMGPPPIEFAKTAGRMNAPGIVVLYASLQPSAALVEATGGYVHVTLAHFVTTLDLLVVDLTEIPPVPSIFEGGPREALEFLRHFVDDISKPFTPDKEVHIEYTPTQVVSEFLRRRFMSSDRRLVNGILYRSAKDDGSTNLALFLSSEDVEGTPRDWWQTRKPCLRLERTDELTIAATEATLPRV
jgi:RES domain-containing protein